MSPKALCPTCGASEWDPCHNERQERMSYIHRSRRKVIRSERTTPSRNMSGKDRRRRFAAVARRDGPLCHWCGSTDAPTLDHVVPLSAGGTNAIDNLVIACEPCNQERGGVHANGCFPGLEGRPTRKRARGSERL